jgi:hypothetical protein
MGFLGRFRKTPEAGSPTETHRPFPAAMVAEAKANPNGWVYEIEGQFGPNDAVPPTAIRGGWKVGPTGQLTGEYKANPNFAGTSASHDPPRR